MDRSMSSVAEYPAAVRTARVVALDLLLSAPAGERPEPAPAAGAGRVVPKDSVLWQPQDGRGAGRESQTHPAADAHSGHRSVISQTELESPGAGPRSLPVPAARCGDRKAQPGLEHRYHLRSDARRVSLPGRRD